MGGAGTAPGRGQAIQRGEFTERDILDHRVRVCDPMQYGCVFLTGDAAHLITPAGGKGVNMAVQDAVELASGRFDDEVVDARVEEGPDQAGDVGGLAGERPRLGGWLTQPERGGPLVKHVAIRSATGRSATSAAPKTRHRSPPR